MHTHLPLKFSKKVNDLCGSNIMIFWVISLPTCNCIIKYVHLYAYYSLFQRNLQDGLEIHTLTNVKTWMDHFPTI